MRRISIRDKKFSECSDEGVLEVSNTEYEVVIVNAAPIARAYYKGEYEPDKLVVPTCWSSNTQTPSADVPEDQRQAGRCMDCHNNIRGSGYKSSRACRFSQRIAVVPKDRLGEVYQLRLPATSIFGEVRGGDMPMKAYAHFLAKRDRPAITVLTKMYFDEGSDTPKLFFKPTRPLRDEEISVVSDMINDPDTIRAITLEYTPSEGNAISPFEVTDGFKTNN
jgi:hypothetical protein|tara:strand:+ start:3186 stop:3848 length:663 start_codon:yes stop_codon:yes gene_type:complete